MSREEILAQIIAQAEQANDVVTSEYLMAEVASIMSLMGDKVFSSEFIDIIEVNWELECD